MKPDPITVSQLNKYMKEKVDSDEFLNNILIKEKANCNMDLDINPYSTF